MLAGLQEFADKTLPQDGRVKVGTFMIVESHCSEFVKLLEQLILANTSSYTSGWQYSVKYHLLKNELKLQFQFKILDLILEKLSLFKFMVSNQNINLPSLSFSMDTS